jgi:two-component system, chemotaxis family, protein-glutamate methylesterase/glutaminase
MTIRVMLVDDSAVVRGLITRALAAATDIQVVTSAHNGAVAISLAKQYQPDIIILDIEMPEMDGITALPKLLEMAPRTKVIMASTLTLRNADISLKLGASDYVSKPSARDPEELKQFYHELYEKIYALAGNRKTRAAASSPATALPLAPPLSDAIVLAPADVPMYTPKALAIASSTGGPQALMNLFGGLKGKLGHLPIFLTQHMPPNFTTILAQHISQAGERVCTEGKNGEEVKAGQCYLAPGGYHMQAALTGGKVVVRLNQDPPVNFCRPAADPMFKSLSEVYGKYLLAVVLTGMGHDGLDGAKTIVAAGGSVVAQDEATSVVWGMPKAVAVGHLCRAVLPLNEIAGYLLKRTGG